MSTFALFQSLAAVVVLGVLVYSGLRRSRSILDWTWMAFCASAAASLLLRALGDAVSPFAFLLLAPASATCGVSWLLARALFRPGRPYGAPHLAVVAVIAAVNLAPTGVLGAAPGNLQMLLSSTVIVLTLWEATRGWAGLDSRAERRLRIFYGTVVATAVLVAVVWLREPAGPIWLDDAVETLALLAVTAAAWACVIARTRMPLHAPSPAANASGRPRERRIDPEISDLARRLDQLVRAEALYLTGNLKVADLGHRLLAADYKITRAITGPLGCTNFNQYVNRFRIDHARQLIEQDPARSILAVALDSGFASVGPFNRAFKAQTGVTPTAYRHQRAAGGLTGETPARAFSPS